MAEEVGYESDATTLHESDVDVVVDERSDNDDPANTDR